MATPSQNKYLLFTLHGSLYALDLQQIAEVGDIPTLYPIPLVPACYSGSFNYHGTIVAALNPSTLMGETSSTPPGKIIVIRREIAALALLVDEVASICDGNGEPHPAPLPHIFSLFTLETPNGEALLVNLDMLIKEVETATGKR